MGTEVFSEKCRQRVKLPKVQRLKKEALTKELLIKLLRNLPAKLQAAALLALSSGLRVGEITGLTLADIEFNSEPVKINVRAETSKSGEDQEEPQFHDLYLRVSVDDSKKIKKFLKEKRIKLLS